MRLCALPEVDSGKSQDGRPKLESKYRIGAHAGRLRRGDERGKKGKHDKVFSQKL